jgi:SPP1 family predicted phage head-tail adaptor
MKAGALNKYVTIQAAVEVADSYGQPIVTWTTWKQVWASIEPVSGREYFAVQQTQSEVNQRVRIRYLDGLTTKHRILYGARTMDIEAIINTAERDREMVLMCIERV